MTTKKKTLLWRVDLPSLLEELLLNTNAPGVVMGANLSIQIISQIAKRAAQLDDDYILIQMWRLGFVDFTDSDKRDYGGELLKLTKEHGLGRDKDKNK